MTTTIAPRPTRSTRDERGAISLSGVLASLLGTLILTSSLLGLYRTEILPTIQDQGITAVSGLDHGLDCLAAAQADPPGC